MASNTDPSPSPAYQVLARKYRPALLADLKGQDALVRTLTNAIAANRIAHAFLLTGIRGVGKTTTARIIARSLNCIGPDGKGGPTITPCGICQHCVAIKEDRHPDILEMDAASRTGVGDIREIIENARYLPVMARYKVYIIDEVHMLSNNAFNALLKTLEEPPSHVKFIFATTELRKIPVTILSRCQRFDLKRVEADVLCSHLKQVLDQEGGNAEPEALMLISQAAEGSVRDSLSLLDQAIAHAAGNISDTENNTNTSPITVEIVRNMLGLSDRSQLFSLLETLLRGDIAASLSQLRALYQAGADPVLLLQDLLEISHLITQVKLMPGWQSTLLAETDYKESKTLAEELSIPVLTRLWQMLLKGLQEIRTAPSGLSALEMILVRIAYAADMPSPGDLVKKLTENQEVMDAPGILRSIPAVSPAPPAPSAASTSPALFAAIAPVQKVAALEEKAPVLQESAHETVPEESPIPAPAFFPEPENFPALVELFSANRELILYHALLEDVELVYFEPGKVEFHPLPEAPKDLATRVMGHLQQWTGKRWTVVISGNGGTPTLKAQKDAAAEQLKKTSAEHPLVKAVLDFYPDSTITKVMPVTSSDTQRKAVFS